MVNRLNPTIVGRNVSDREHVEIVAEQSAAARDHAFERLNRDRDMFVAAEEQRHAERMAYIAGQYAAARDRIFTEHERNQEAAQAYVDGRARRRLAARFGLQLAFFDEVNLFGVRDRYAPRPRAVEA